MTSLINKILKETSLEIRYKISIEMEMITMLTNAGLRKNKMWRENKKDNKILAAIGKSAKKLAKEHIRILKEWEKYGKP